MPRRCKLCKKSVMKDSMFCSDHHNQARMFSASFGRQPTATQPLGTPLGGSASPTGSEASAADGEPERRRPRTGDSPNAQEPSGPVIDEFDISETTLAAKVNQTLERIRGRASEHAERDASRWPQISVYVIHDKLMARAFYTIIPTVEEGEGVIGQKFRITENKVADALREDGVVFRELVKQLESHRESLANRETQTLDVQLCTYAGVIAINESTADHRESNLATFTLNGDAFERAENTEVQERLRHDRWV